MTPARELLLANGIRLAAYTAGEHTSVCPRCSQQRNKKKTECLDVKITADDRAYWNCHHCGWTGPERRTAGNGPADRLVYYVYNDPSGAPVRRKVRNLPGREPKMWWQHWNGAGWVKPAEHEISREARDWLYRIDEVRAAIARGEEIAVVEGEKDADRLWSIDIAATCSPNGAAAAGHKPKWFAAYSAQLAGADIVVFNDNDAAGLAHAAATVKACARSCARVTRVVMSELWPQAADGEDISDFLDSAGSPNDVHAAIGAAAAAGPGKAEKPKAEARARILYAEFEPWPHAVDPAGLLTEIAAAASRHVVMPKGGAEKAALWTMHSWVFRASTVSPRLRIFAPEPECGKTTLLSFIGRLARKPQPAANVSPAVLYRLIARYNPTFLIDEFDSFAFDSENELPNVINSGHEISGYVLRCRPNDHEPEAFATFGPVAYAHIGRLPPRFRALLSRSIPIRLDRRAPGQHVEPLPPASQFGELNRKLCRFATDFFHSLEAAQPTLPPFVDNRAADNWRLLLAIADLAGESWSTRARAIIDAPDDLAGRSTMVLADIRELFDSLAVDGFLGSQTILEHLLRRDDRNYNEWNRGRPMTKVGLSNVLDTYNIHPTRSGHYKERGYLQVAFEQAWSSYLRAPASAIPSTQSGQSSASSQNQGLTAADSKGFSQNVSRLQNESSAPSPNGRTTLEDWIRDADDILD